MILKKIKFENSSWSLAGCDQNAFVLNPNINLIVGKNGSGKTKLLNTIYGSSSFFIRSKTNDFKYVMVLSDGKNETYLNECGTNKHEFYEWADRVNFVNNNFESVLMSNEESLQMLTNDLTTLGYDVELIFNSARRLGVKEAGSDDFIYKDEMSRGLISALSVLIKVNSCLLNKSKKYPNASLLIDDFGDGLDYQRCRELTHLILEKVRGTHIQLIMATNNEVVMNAVPLEYWSIIHRKAKKSVVYNIHNSKDKFDEFVFTGLNNFDFFGTEFYLNGFE